MKRIAALTTVRNSPHFLHRWISHYGALLGYENLFVIFDGLDEALPKGCPHVNVLAFEHVHHSRSVGDKKRAERASDVAGDLFKTYDLVLGTDVDEFLVLDPNMGISLAAYLSDVEIPNCISAMGLDVAQHLGIEGALNWDEPFLGQRRICMISDRYTKAVVLGRPLRWGSGFHRVKGHGFSIDPNLFLFHFGSVDCKETEARLADTERKAGGWGAHQNRRISLTAEISAVEKFPTEDRLKSARSELSKPRSLIAWNKPRPLKSDRVVRIPERFYGLV